MKYTNYVEEIAKAIEVFNRLHNGHFSRVHSRLLDIYGKEKIERAFTFLKKAYNIK